MDFDATLLNRRQFFLAFLSPGILAFEYQRFSERMQAMGVSVDNLWSWLSSAPLWTQALMVFAVIALVALIVLAVRVALAARRLRAASKPGRQASTVARGRAIPPTNFARDGRPSDPLNVRVHGTADQLAAAFIAAGWYRADEITLVTSIRIAIDAILGRKYSTAPVSDLYLFGRKQDFAFEKPGRNVRERDHVRFWNSRTPQPDGRSLWIGGATRDSRVELSKTNLLPTHGIAPDVDDERELIFHDLARTGWVIAATMVPDFSGPTKTTNAMGDEYFTDGEAISLTLANIQPLPFVPQLVRRSAAPLARSVASGLRPLLPRQGRDFAREWEEKRPPARRQTPPSSDS